MKKASTNFLDFEIDKLTRSIENAFTGGSVVTNVSLLLKADLKQITKKNGWVFNWKTELNKQGTEVYKLTIQEDLNIVHGLISIRLEPDHIFMDLIESAPSNRGKNKVYLGVAGNLVAFACRLSFQTGFNGFTAFYAKTKLIDHYKQSLGARHSGGQLMVIDESAARALVDKYFKE